VARLAGDDVDDTASGIAAVETALRSLENFHALDIDEVVGEAAIYPRHVVDEGRDARVGANEDVVADAANVELRIAGAAQADEARRLETQVGDRFQALRFQAFAGYRGDRQRHLDHALLAALRRNDDVAVSRTRQRGLSERQDQRGA